MDNKILTADLYRQSPRRIARVLWMTLSIPEMHRLQSGEPPEQYSLDETVGFITDFGDCIILARHRDPKNDDGFNHFQNIPKVLILRMDYLNVEESAKKPDLSLSQEMLTLRMDDGGPISAAYFASRVQSLEKRIFELEAGDEHHHD